MDSTEKEAEQRTNAQGPSWLLMLFLMFLAIVAAVAIAWAFITPLLHRH